MPQSPWSNSSLIMTGSCKWRKGERSLGTGCHPGRTAKCLFLPWLSSVHHISLFTPSLCRFPFPTYWILNLLACFYIPDILTTPVVLKWQCCWSLHTLVQTEVYQQILVRLPWFGGFSGTRRFKCVFWQSFLALDKLTWNFVQTFRLPTGQIVISRCPQS